MTHLGSPAKQLIDGQWVDASDGGSWEVIDPGTEQVVATVPFGGAADANRAIESASRAWPKWRAHTAYERAAILQRAASLLRERAPELARVTVHECGKPLLDATREWLVAADFCEFYAEEGKRVYGHTIPARSPSRRMLVLHEPIGVVGVITAWNFPAYNPARAVSAALAAGCPVVVRPSELTPLSAMAFGAALVDAGLPPGVLSVVNGDAWAMGQAMLDHPALRKISFTGSTAVGRLLMDGASRTVTRLSLELGGNAPVLILPDVDLVAVAKAAVAARFRNAGQVCVSPQRFLVARKHMETFEQVVVEESRKLKVGVGFDPAVRVGPLASQRHLERVQGILGQALQSGARLCTGGRRPPDCDRGFFLEPTVLGDVSRETPAFADEVFGPLLCMTAFDQLDEAIALANQTDYGLAAYVFTNDLAAAMYAYERLDFGMVGVNEWAPQATEAPFCGRKASGIGHEGGREGLFDNLQTKLVSIGGLLPGVS